MGEVVEFKRKPKSFFVSVCGVNQDYQTFEVDNVSKPTANVQQFEALYLDDVVTIDEPEGWLPVTIKGTQELYDAIRYANTPLRVTFETIPRRECWYELQNVYMQADSTVDVMKLRFFNCIKHSYK